MKKYSDVSWKWLTREVNYHCFLALTLSSFFELLGQFSWPSTMAPSCPCSSLLTLTFLSSTPLLWTSVTQLSCLTSPSFWIFIHKSVCAAFHTAPCVWGEVFLGICETHEPSCCSLRRQQTQKSKESPEVLF